VPIVIRLQDIDEAIENLHYKSETTLKAKLIRAVRQYYIDDSSSESLQAIDTEELVKIIWETGEDRELLKAKRKNFSSVKSSVNSDLKKLYTEGKNPQGLVIGQANTFTISDEAKDKALTGIMDVFQDMGIDTQSKMSKILSSLSDVLSHTTADASIESTREEIDRLKNMMSGLSEKLGLSLEDLVAQTSSGREESQTGPGAPPALPELNRQDLSDSIQDDISALDRGLARLASKAADTAGDEQTGVKEALHQALTDIVDVLRDQETDLPGKAQKILTAVEQMVDKAIDASGDELSGDEAGQLKQIFSEMSQGTGVSAGGDARTAGPPPLPSTATEEAQAAPPLLSRVSDILSEAEGSAGDKIGRIMAAVNDMIGEALAGSGLSDEEIAGLKEMMGNITTNLEAFAQGVLAEEDIIEEIIEEEAAEGAQTVEEASEEAAAEQEIPADETIAEDAGAEEAPAGAEDEIIEVLEEAVGEETESALPAGDAGPAAEGAEEILEVVEGEAPPASEGEIIEVIEEIVEGEESLPAEPPADARTQGEDATGEIGPGEGIEAELPAEGEIIEVIEEVAGPEEPLPTEAIPETEVQGEAAAGEIVEVIEEVTGPEEPLSTETIPETEAQGEAASGDIGPVESLEAAPVEMIEEVIEESPEESAAGEIEIVEEISDATAPETAEDLAAEAASVEALEEASAETVEMDEAELAALEEVSGEAPPPGEAAVAETGDEIIEEVDAGSGTDVKPSDEPVDEELREKTELLSRLAEAAGVLEKLGPDLSGSIYTEEELRSKAKFLSEEFDRYLGIRDKFYNSHILIKSGDYLVGGAHMAKSELAEQIVSLPDFYIGKFPVTNALFEIFVEQTGYITTAEKFGYGLVYYPRMQRSRDPVTGTERFTLHSQTYYKRVMGACWYRPTGPDSSLHLKRTHPVVQVSLEDARAYAAWTGKRLPTEIEWEASARTARSNLYPWGNEWQEDACNIEKSLHGDTTPVDQYVKFANSYEVADMLGNVLEWTMDAVGDQETSETYIVKGASWISHGEISLTDRHYIEKTTSSNIIGFRCIAI